MTTIEPGRIDARAGQAAADFLITATDLALAGRILIGLPERDLLIAAGVAEGDDEFALMFADYVADRANADDEPIDDRVFELVDGELIPLEASFGT